MTPYLSTLDVQRLQAFAAILLRCFAITTIALLFVWAVVLVARKPLLQVHAQLVGTSEHEFDLLLYGFLTLIKCLNVVLFLFPWLAIRHFLRK